MPWEELLDEFLWEELLDEFLWKVFLDEYLWEEPLIVARLLQRGK